MAKTQHRTLAEIYAEQHKEGAGETLTQKFFTFREAGDTLRGVFKYYETVTPKADMGPVNRYVFMTDEGDVSCLLGASTDKKMADKLRPGDCLDIVFEGKRTFDGGSKQVNEFTISRWGRITPDTDPGFFASIPEAYRVANTLLSGGDVENL